MGQNYDTGGALRRPFEAPAGTGTLFGRTMRLVVVTAALFPLGAYLARNLSGGWSLVFWIASLACLLASCWRPRSSSTSSTSSSSFLSLRLGVAIDGSDRPTDDAPNLTTGRRTHDVERE
jgi:hypothetical protein